MVKFLKKLAGLDPRKKFSSDEEGYEEYEDYINDEFEDDVIDEEVQNEEAEEEETEWLDEDFEEGQLSIDVFQTPETLVVKSTIAGVKPSDIDISINNDMLTIRGKREENLKIKEDDYLFKECYWGSFSRSIILPMEVEAEHIEANLENGVLTITLPKAKNAKQISIKVKEK